MINSNDSGESASSWSLYMYTSKDLFSHVGTQDTVYVHILYLNVCTYFLTYVLYVCMYICMYMR